MKKLFSFFVGAICLVSRISFAQENNSMLWEISGNGLQQPSYIQGTFHMMCAKDFQMKQKTIDALGKVKRLVLELNYTDPTEMAAVQKMMQSEQKLSEKLSADEATELNEVLKSYGVTLQAVNNYSPQALYSFIGQKATPCPQTEIKMYEIELLTLAAKSGKTFGGLEKVADQTDALGKSYDLKEIIRQLKAGDEYAILSKSMIKAFNEENLIALDELLKDERFMNKEQEDLMLNQRNINWVSKKMPEMMEKESVLFAVGGGHLLGKEGVLNLLKEKGYTIKPVR